MSNRRDIQFTYNPHNKATILDCSFVVDPTNANGFGVSSLNKSGRIGSVFMHTSQTPGTASNGQVNPNPANGVIVVTLQDNYNTLLGVKPNFLSQLSGSSISISGSTVMTVGAVYVITALGTSTQANWVAAGLSPSVTAAVGVPFVAAITGGGTGTGTVQAPAAAGAGVDHIEVQGNANLANNTQQGQILGAGVGMQIFLAAFKNTVLTAPTALSTIYLTFYMNNSAQGV